MVYVLYTAVVVGRWPCARKAQRLPRRLTCSAQNIIARYSIKYIGQSLLGYYKYIYVKYLYIYIIRARVCVPVSACLCLFVCVRVYMYLCKTSRRRNVIATLISIVFAYAFCLYNIYVVYMYAQHRVSFFRHNITIIIMHVLLLCYFFFKKKIFFSHCALTIRRLSRKKKHYAWQRA